MTNEMTDWELPELGPDDQRLVDAYLRTGRTVDDLVYTPEMSQIVRSMGEPDDEKNKRQFFLRLVRLRKMGRLPRIGRRASA